MKKRIIFRVDGSTSIGMGHAIRCCAMADMLKNEFAIFFAIQQPVESLVKLIETITPETIISLPLTNDYVKDATSFSSYLAPGDIVVLDGYNFDTRYQEIVKACAHKLVCIDDIHAYHFVADAIFNQNACISKADYSREPYTKIYAGMDYVLLRPPFLEAAMQAKRKLEKAETYFINMGGADIGNVTMKVLQSITISHTFKDVHVLVGAVNPNKQVLRDLIEAGDNIHYHEDLSAEQLRNLLLKCDVAICPASSISMEACAVGIGLISGYTANNQKGILDTMSRYKTMVNFGDFNTITKEEMAEKINLFSSNIKAINEQIKNQQRLIDGKSGNRIRSIFNTL